MRALILIVFAVGCADRPLAIPEAPDLGSRDLSDPIDLFADVDLASPPDLTPAPDLSPNPHCAGSGTLSWIERFGEVGQNLAEVVLVGADGFELSGVFSQHITFGALPQLVSASPSDLFGVHLDRLGVPRAQRLGAILATDGSGDKVLDVDNSITLVDAAGQLLWQHPIDAHYQPQAAIDGLGRIVVAGQVWGFSSVDFGSGPVPLGDVGSLFIAVYEPGGELVHAQAFDLGTNWYWDLILESMTADAEGNVYLAGTLAAPNGIGDGTALPMYTRYLAKYGPDGALVWRQTPTGDFKRVEAAPGGLLFARSDRRNSNNDRRIVVEKLDAAGNPTWTWGFDGGQARTLGLASGPAGEVVWMGSLSGDADLGGGPLLPYSMDLDLAVARLDAGGAHVWSKRLASSQPPGVFSGTRQAAIDAEGTVVISGAIVGDFDVCGVPAPTASKGDIVVAAFGG